VLRMRLTTSKGSFGAAVDPRETMPRERYDRLMAVGSNDTLRAVVEDTALSTATSAREWEVVQTHLCGDLPAGIFMDRALSA